MDRHILWGSARPNPGEYGVFQKKFYRDAPHGLAVESHVGLTVNKGAHGKGAAQRASAASLTRRPGVKEVMQYRRHDSGRSRGGAGDKKGCLFRRTQPKTQI